MLLVFVQLVFNPRALYGCPELIAHFMGVHNWLIHVHFMGVHNWLFVQLVFNPRALYGCPQLAVSTIGCPQLAAHFMGVHNWLSTIAGALGNS
jgi:hypothetical protein